jgi:hypothetical protein
LTVTKQGEKIHHILSGFWAIAQLHIILWLGHGNAVSQLQ